MTAINPIVPSPKQVDQWLDDAVRLNGITKYYIATQAAQWGADQELEACAKEISYWSSRNLADRLRDCRRPKPPSLKEQALHELNDVYNRDKIDDSTYDTIRRALETLPE